MLIKSIRLFACLVVVLFCTTSGVAQVDESSPRVTPLVKVIRQIEPSVAALFTTRNNQIFSGSGMIIHRDGYILTNHHVLPSPDGMALIGTRRPIPFKVIARLPESDIAIVKLQQVPSDLQAMPIGRSADLMNGESVVVAGNPGGRGMVFTSGIVSAKDVLGGPNALVMSNYETSRRDRFIQFDAASNRGNSGGPLVNMEGQVIGIVAATVQEEQNSGLAIPIDRVRSQFERMFESETLHGRQIGVSLDPFSNQLAVETVAAESPAAKAGIQAGDRLLELDGSPLQSATDWTLRLDQLLAKNATMQLRVARQSEFRTVELKPQTVLPMQPVEVQNPQTGLKAQLFEGKYNALPDFGKLKAVREVVCSELKNLQEIYQDRAEHFAILLEGYLRVDDDGLYRLILLSDDGSKLRLGDNWWIDNDGNHPPKAVGRLVRLKKGYYPIRFEYFQGTGEKRIELYYERVTTQATLGLEVMREVEPVRLVHVK